MTALRMLRRGDIKGRQVCPGAPWVIKAADLASFGGTSSNSRPLTPNGAQPELTGLRQQDLHLGTGAHVRVIGKGRKERCTPLSKNTRTVLAAWVKQLPNCPDQPLFPNARGGHLSAHGVHYLLAKHVVTATSACPSLKHKRVSPHVLRHTTAMDLLQQGVEQSVIAPGSVMSQARPHRSTWMQTLS